MSDTDTRASDTGPITVVVNPITYDRAETLHWIASQRTLLRNCVQRLDRIASHGDLTDEERSDLRAAAHAIETAIVALNRSRTC